jgi:hypothetical protein
LKLGELAVAVEVALVVQRGQLELAVVAVVAALMHLSNSKVHN